MLTRFFVRYFLGFVLFSASSFSFSSVELTYETYPDGVGISGCSYSPCPSEIIIPEMINSKKVTRIEDGAFCHWYNINTNPTSIILPSTLKHIGEEAFCNLDSIVIPSSVVSIVNGAFDGFEGDLYILKPAEQSINVFDLPVDANLYACDGLDENGNPINCEDAYPGITRNLLDYDTATALIDSTGHVEIPNTYTMIEDGVSFGGITSITIPDSILHIGEEVFYGNNLDSIILPNSVVSIVNGTFDGFEGDIYIIKPVDQYINPYYLPDTSNHYVCESLDSSGNPVGCEDLWQSTTSGDQPGNQYAILDIDQNGSFDALTDGLILLRYAFGLRGDSLINGVVDTNANRTSAFDIEVYIQTLVP